MREDELNCSKNIFTNIISGLLNVLNIDIDIKFKYLHNMFKIFVFVYK